MLLLQLCGLVHMQTKLLNCVPSYSHRETVFPLATLYTFFFTLRVNYLLVALPPFVFSLVFMSYNHKKSRNSLDLTGLEMKVLNESS